jgi:hypothetical protein
MPTNVRLSGSQTSARSESDVRYNPQNVLQLIAASNNLSFNPQAQFYSNDGGATWSQTNLPSVTGDSNQSDPCVDWTGDGNAWALTVGVGSSNIVRCFKSTDAGATWTHDSDVSGTQNNVDKPNLWVDHSPTSPHTDNMYALWWNNGPTYVARRAGTSGSWQTPVQVSGSETTGGSDGGDIKTNSFGDVFAFWPSESDLKLFVAKSTDGGATFGTPVKIADTFSDFLFHVPSDEPSRGTLLYITAGAYRTATVDMVYAVWMDLAGGSGCNATSNMPGTDVTSKCKTRIWFSRSTDGGATWSSPIKINDQDSLNDQFFPRLAVDPGTGAMMVVYYDTINDSARLKTDLWMQTSLDNGATWSGASQVTTAATDETASGYNTYQYGDYIGLTCQDGNFFASWTDRRGGSYEEIWGAALIIADMEFKIDQDTYGKDEVAVSGSFAPAYWLAISGCTNASLGLNSPSDLNNPPSPAPTITATIDPASNPTLTAAQISNIAANLPTVNTFGPGPIVPTDPTLALQGQVFFYPYTVSFPNNIAFAALGLHQFAFITLTATFTVGGLTITRQALIELTNAEDPRFKDLDPSNPQAFPSWLSFDLRFFTVSPSTTHQYFNVANPADATGAVSYIQNVLANLNTPGAIANGDTFDSTLTQDEENSSLGFLQTDKVLNFAIARVRILAHTVTTVNNVRVFFRLFQAASTVSNFAEVGTNQGTYRWGTNGTAGHKIPLLGVQKDQNGNLEYVTIPCFASARIDPSSAAMNTQTDTPNVQNITTVSDTEVDTYFGCWLDLNQSADVILGTPPSSQSQWDGPWTPNASINSSVVNAPHQCLIAEIRFDDVPTPPGATYSTSDKLAQRNIAWIDGPNPGTDPSRVMPHPFEIRSTLNAQQPDELMITWGKTPRGSTASIYLPAVQSSAVIALANRLYPAHNLTASDAHTIECPTGGATLVPVPQGLGRYAGLLSVNLPLGIHKGDVFDIAVRQLQVVQAVKAPPPPPPPKISVALPTAIALAAVSTKGQVISWRQACGAFQFTITISTKNQILLKEERLLAWIKWRLEVMPHTSRWFPVLTRYLKLIWGRVQGFGGDPGSILPSQYGNVPGHPVHPLHPGHHHDDHYTGKVIGIAYDRFGDFAGFTLLTEHGHEHHFRGREKEIETLVRQAWLERFVITVYLEGHHSNWPSRIVLRHAPYR